MASPPLLAQRVARCALLIAAILATFWPALSGGILAWDDQEYLWDPTILGENVFWERLFSVVTTPHFANYIPINRLVFWAQLGVFGLSPIPLHLMSVLMHAANALVVMMLCAPLGLGWRVGLVGALLFALHPTRVESVAWLAEQKDLQFSFFAILAVWAQLRSLRSVALLLMVLSLLSKPMAVMLPAVFLALDLGRGRPFLQSLKEQWPFLVVGGAFAVLGARLQPSVSPTGDSWESHYATNVQTPFHYVMRVLWPAGYSARHWMEPEPHLLSWRPLVAMAGLALVVVVTLLLLRTGARRHAMLLVGWPVAAMLPVANIIPAPVELADRYLYFAMVGPCLVVAEALMTSRLLRGASVVLVLACAWVTHERSAVFYDDETLWRASVASEPDNPIARAYLANLIAPTRPDEAYALVKDPWPAAERVQLVQAFRTRVLVATGHSEEARQVHARATELARRVGWQTLVLAHETKFLTEAGKHAEAHELVAKARPSVDKTQDQILHELSLQCVNAKDGAGFLRITEEQLRRDPFNLVVWKNRAKIAGLAGEPKIAEEARARFEALGGDAARARLPY